MARSDAPLLRGRRHTGLYSLLKHPACCIVGTLSESPGREALTSGLLSGTRRSASMSDPHPGGGRERARMVNGSHDRRVAHCLQTSTIAHPPSGACRSRQSSSACSSVPLSCSWSGEARTSSPLKTPSAAWSASSPSTPSACSSPLLHSASSSSTSGRRSCRSVLAWCSVSSGQSLSSSYGVPAQSGRLTEEGVKPSGAYR